MKKKSLYSIIFILIILIIQSGAANAVNAAEVGSSENSLDEVFELLAPGGAMPVAAVMPTDALMCEAVNSYIYNYIGNKVDTSKYSVNCVINSESDFDKVPLEIRETNVTDETRNIKLVFAEPDAKIQSAVNECISAINEFKDNSEDTLPGCECKLFYKLKDLNIINYYNYIATEKDGKEDASALDTVFNCLQDLKKLIGSNDITYKVDFRGGDIIKTQPYTFGYLQLLHDGILYGAVNRIGLRQLNVIYIPDGTSDDSSSYIAAAQNRIKKELNIEPEIKVAGSISDLPEEVDFTLFGDKDKAGSDYYSIDFGNNFVRDFIILRDSENCLPRQFEYYAKNEKTNDADIEVIIKSAKEVLNVTVKVKKLNEKKFFDIIGTDNAFVYDIKLTDKTTGNNISRLEDGEFEVSIPIPEILKNKKLAVYYINDDGQKEVYSVRIENGKAVFKTNHFSVYALAEFKDDDDKGESNVDNGDTVNEPEDKDEPNKNTENPKTGDNSTALTVCVYLTSIIVLLTAVCQTVRRIKVKRCKL